MPLASVKHCLTENPRSAIFPIAADSSVFFTQIIILSILYKTYYCAKIRGAEAAPLHTPAPLPQRLAFTNRSTLASRAESHHIHIRKTGRRVACQSGQGRKAAAVPRPIRVVCLPLYMNARRACPTRGRRFFLSPRQKPPPLNEAGALFLLQGRRKLGS